MNEIKIFPLAGEFAENKDVAKEIRLNKIIPTIEKGDDIILNFQDVNTTTQSFIHALISDLFRKYGGNILDRITFKSCNETVQKIIAIVVDYMQEAL